MKCDALPMVVAEGRSVRCRPRHRSLSRCWGHSVISMCDDHSGAANILYLNGVPNSPGKRA